MPLARAPAPQRTLKPLPRFPTFVVVLALLGLGAALWWFMGGAPKPPPPTQANAATQTELAPPNPNTLVTAADEKQGTPDCLGPAPSVPPAPPPPYPLSGQLGLWVAEVDPATLQPIRAVGTHPNGVFPLASTYKQAVLWATLQAFDGGAVSPTDRFDVTGASQSLGEYPFDGTNVRTLSERMIRNSDNTATDILHREVGLERVQSIADGLRLCRTRLILPTKDWWVMQAGISETFQQHPDWWQRPDRLALAQQIDAEAQQVTVHELVPVLDNYFETQHQPADDLNVHNVSTPYEFSTLLAHQYLRPSLSERAERWQGEVARLGYGRAGLRAAQVGNVDTFYGKGGNGWRLLTYTGYFHTKDGHHVVYAFMQHGADEWYTMPNTYRAFAWINAAVDQVIGKQKKPEPEPKLYLRPPTQAEKGGGVPGLGAGAKYGDFAPP